MPICDMIIKFLLEGFFLYMQQDFVKLTNAVYQTVEFFPEDPLKLRSKKQALLVLEGLTRGSETVAKDIEVLLRYLELAKLQGWMSDMNYLIITKQYREILPKIPNSKPQVPSNAEPQKTQPKKPEKVEERKTLEKPQDFSDRQVKILDILKSKQKAQVADLIKQLPKVTKRTIRRDLDELLRKRVVVRVGQFNQVFYELVRT